MIELKSYLEKDWSEPIEEAFENGVAYAPHFLDSKTLSQLQDLVRRLKPSRNPFSERSRLSFQKSAGNGPLLLPWSGREESKTLPVRILGEIGERMGDYTNKFPTLANWKPNILSFLYYDKDVKTPIHKDLKTLLGLGMTFTILGEGVFSVMKTPHTDPFASWNTKPGDAVFLRMTGLNPDISYEDEIFHRVDAPTRGPRASVVIRQGPDKSSL